MKSCDFGISARNVPLPKIVMSQLRNKWLKHMKLRHVFAKNVSAYNHLPIVGLCACCTACERSRSWNAQKLYCCESVRKEICTWANGSAMQPSRLAARTNFVVFQSWVADRSRLHLHFCRRIADGMGIVRCSSNLPTRRFSIARSSIPSTGMKSRSRGKIRTSASGWTGASKLPDPACSHFFSWFIVRHVY